MHWKSIDGGIDSCVLTESLDSVKYVFTLIVAVKRDAAGKENGTIAIG